MCDRVKRRREESVFEVELERLQAVLLEKRQRLKLEALTTVAGLFAGSPDEGVRSMLVSVAKEVLASHLPAPEASSESEESEASDPDYLPGDPSPEPEPEPALVQIYDPEGPVRAEIPSTMLFFSALSNDRPAPRGMLALDLYTSYRQFCAGQQGCCDDEDVLIQARSSFGMQLRTIRGVCKEQSPGGTRYAFHWPAIVRHLRAAGTYCKDARLC